MAELIPAPFRDLVTRLYREPTAQDSLFELPRRKWYLPDDAQPDLSVQFHGVRAGNPSGPASGPHTQMAQNLLLRYSAGGRILELNTVQENDRLEIGRPCIDITNVGYNIEWSQELRVEDTLREYVAGAMLIEMYRRNADLTGEALDGPGGDVIYDISVGYDLRGIRSAKVTRFLEGMRDARPLIDRLRAEIPREFSFAESYDYPARLSDSVTLSTFHGCPADEIESICEHLIAQHDFDVIVKMNPPTLGRERLEQLLCDVMGYTALRVNPKAYAAAISFDESIELCERLTRFAARRDRRVGFKFSNTLEVENHRDFFPAGNDVMYLSGQPLHVITMALTDEFRRRAGPDVPISFSAGIDAQNFPLAVACGFVPVTVCSDLLRPGGYGRLPSYLASLAKEMRKAGAESVDAYILRRFEQERGACACADAESLASASGSDREPGSGFDARAVRSAGLLNTSIVARMAREDTRYRAEKNGAVPKRIDSHLAIFDCITCDKCLPVCPNAANFKYPTPKVSFDYHDVLVSPDGRWRKGELRHFEISAALQIACYADFCNECGNCDTFCPEYGGPYIEKPSFFGSVASWERAAPRDGFVTERTETHRSIRGRIKGVVFRLARDHESVWYRFEDDAVEATFPASDHELTAVKFLRPPNQEHRLDMWAYHTLRHLLDGVLDASRVNQINAEWVNESP